MEPKYVALENLLKDEEALAKLSTSQDAEETSKILKEEFGLDFSPEELREVGEGMKRALEDDSMGELSESDLEMVAGGKQSTAYKVGYYIGKGVKIAATVLKFFK